MVNVMGLAQEQPNLLINSSYGQSLKENKWVP